MISGRALVDLRSVETDSTPLPKLIERDGSGPTYANDQRANVTVATDYLIAFCLRHSTTAVVRRYAHLSPTHLQGVIERVSAFGKTSAS